MIGEMEGVARCVQASGLAFYLTKTTEKKKSKNYFALEQQYFKMYEWVACNFWLIMNTITLIKNIIEYILGIKYYCYYVVVQQYWKSRMKIVILFLLEYLQRYGFHERTVIT